MVLGLFSTRIVLDSLGEINYGIYMLVAGVVGILNILNANMSNTSMRYMAHSLGSGDIITTLKTFNTTLFLHFIIGGIMVFIMLLGGWFMFEYLLEIPATKIYDAKIVFILMVITTFITVISVPYDAVMNSHENILALSIVDSIGYVLKLGAAICLLYSKSNLLILYSFLLLLINFSIRITKQLYSKKKYDECKIRFRKYIDTQLMKSILSFTGWNLFGSVAAMAGTQVRGLLINMFFGVKLNAAEGIAKTAGSKINMVSVSLSRAINPQLMKSEGGGDRNRMIRITEIGTKFSSFLFALFAIPVMVEAPYLLNLWLKEVPNYSVIFFQLLILTMMIEKFTFQITHAIRAVGKIREFQIAETFILLLNIPLAYFAFKTGHSPPTIYIIGLLLSVILFFVRLYFGEKIADINIKTFVIDTIIPVFSSIAFSVLIAAIPIFFIPESIWRFVLVLTVYGCLFSISFWLYGLKVNEKQKLKNIFSSFTKF